MNVQAGLLLFQDFPQQGLESLCACYAPARCCLWRATMTYNGCCQDLKARPRMDCAPKPAPVSLCYEWLMLQPKISSPQASAIDLQPAVQVLCRSCGLESGSPGRLARFAASARQDQFGRCGCSVGAAWGRGTEMSSVLAHFGSRDMQPLSALARHQASSSVRTAVPSRFA